MKNPQTRYPVVQKVQITGLGIFLQERKNLWNKYQKNKKHKKNTNFFPKRIDK